MKLLQLLALALAPHPCPPPACPPPPPVYQPAFRPIPAPAFCARRLDRVDDVEQIIAVEGWVENEASAEADYWQQTHPGCRGYGDVRAAARSNAAHWAEGVWGEAIY